MLRLGDLLLDLVQVDVGGGVVAVEDPGDLLEGGAVGLDVEEIDKGEFEGVPELDGVSGVQCGGWKGGRTV